MPKKPHTHYDNLKVPRDADLKTIRAAYRALCKQYHPDRCPDNPEAHRVMSIINRSYKVLTTPEKRRRHDEWIARQSASGTQEPASQRISSPMPKGFRQPEQQVPRMKYLLWLLSVALLIAALFFYTQHQRSAAANDGRDLPVKTQPQTAGE